MNHQSISRWAPAVVLTAGAQAAIQLIAFVSGLLVIRLLAPEQYAYYTIANTALGAMIVLSDSGLSSGVMAHGGRVWRDAGALGAVLRAGVALRRRLAAAVLAVALPATYLLLQRQGADPWQAAWVALSIVPLFLTTLTTNLLEVVPRLHQELGTLQRIQLFAGATRAIALLLALPLLPYAAAASVAAAVPQAWANWRLRREAARHVDSASPDDSATRAALIGQIKRALPLALYYAVSGQLTVLLVSLLGSTHDVAAVGALGRLAMIMSGFGAVFTMIALPRFARIAAADHSVVRARYWQAQAALLAVCLLPVLLLASFPEPVLAVLGPHYAGLEHEAVLFALSNVIGSMGGAALALGAVRGFIVPPALAIPCCLASQAALILILPVGTVAGVIVFGLFSSLFQWALHVAYFYWRMFRRQVSMP